MPELPQIAVIACGGFLKTKRVMTKDFFIEEKKKIKDELIILRNRETELIKKYIDSNKEFEVGEKVKVSLYCYLICTQLEVVARLLIII